METALFSQTKKYAKQTETLDVFHVHLAKTTIQQIQVTNALFVEMASFKQMNYVILYKTQTVTHLAQYVKTPILYQLITNADSAEMVRLNLQTNFATL